MKIKIIIPIISNPTRDREFKKKKAKRLIKLKKTPLWLLSKRNWVGKGREREKIKIIVPIISNPTRDRELKKKKRSKKTHKIKKYNYGFFSSKTGWERPRKSENKNYCSDHFLPVP